MYIIIYEIFIMLWFSFTDNVLLALYLKLRVTGNCMNTFARKLYCPLSFFFQFKIFQPTKILTIRSFSNLTKLSIRS